MQAAGHLPSLRGAPAGPVSVKPIADDDGNRMVLLQPTSQRLRRAVGHQGDDATAFKVNQDVSREVTRSPLPHSCLSHYAGLRTILICTY